jgi:protein required for attachment to host cells
MNAPHWVLVANQAEARLLEYRGPHEPMELLREIPHPEGRLKEQDLVSDRPGKELRGTMQASHGYESQVSASEHESEVFAKHLADFLEKERAQDNFGDLSLVAPPHFLGLLRKSFTKSLDRCVSHALPKDLPARWVASHDLKAEVQSLLHQG